MPEVGLTTEPLLPPVRASAKPTVSNFAISPVRGVCVRFRRLIGELLAFPVSATSRDGKLIVTADLPGLETDEVRVEVNESVLVIEVEPKQDDGKAIRSAGRRIIPLPDGIEIGLAKAELGNGILKVSLPMLPKKHRRLPVEGAE